jgi:tetratricopeptide (TPR) repeat protein
MNNLASAYRSAGKPDRALPLLEETLKLTKAKLGADHPHTLTSMNNLASAYRAAGKPDQALPLFRQAAAGIEKRRFQHEYAGVIVKNLIDCHERLKQFDQGESWRRRWLAVVKERSGADSPLYARELASLGQNLLAQQKWADAEPVLRESLAICDKRQPDFWGTSHARSLLGGALAGQEKYAEAEPLLLKGYEGLKQRQAAIPPGNRGVVAQALDRLVQLCRATGQTHRAEAYRKQLDRLRKPNP